ncbi:uncharacterized protein [Neodiprion pinetum]|uniref:uncharacterized protein n=1 Tax=Neodiprion pinetum TaxID=441929 RepID=UPI001EE02CC2|nr:uncharacterized protein LOC124214912 [Neodiprion pinetum]XP_046473620.1 uncharacterized protein LOC124214912 [Neodiprion pinetum]XP_046473621.1 uncharacterized protein LOC124214912 [Neodiprion pinetum]
MMLLRSFFRRIITDFRHKELLPLKLLFFVQAATLYVLYPYLTIHMRELGISVEETAIMSAVTPVVAIVMPPLAGMIADRIGNFKILLSLFSSLGGGAALLLLLVPVGRVTVRFPERIVMDLGCPGSNGDLVYTMSQVHPCDTKLAPEIATRIESCGYICHVDLHNDTEVQAVLTSRGYTVRHYDLTTGSNISYKYTISKSELPQTVIKTTIDDVREHRLLSNNDFYKTSIRQLSKSTYFFPTSELYEFTCRESNATINETRCSFGRFGNKGNKSRDVNYHNYNSTLRLLNATDIDTLEAKRRYLGEAISWTGKSGFQRPNCTNPDRKDQRVVLTVPLVNYTAGNEVYKSLVVDGCSKRCVVTAPRKDVCSNMNTQIEYDVSLTFWLYLAIRVFIGMIGGTAFAMFEGAVIAILRDQKADYGLQRIYGTIGGMISSLLSGLLIDYASSGKEYTDFRPAFYLYAGLKIISGLLMLTINLEFKSPANNVVSDVMSVLKNIEIVALFIACFVLGTAWGYIESFLFWLLQDLGGSRSLMGITITVGGLAGIPLLVMSGPIIEKIGHANVLFIGFIFYAVRLLGYSLIYNPWLCLIFEALESVTSSLSFTAAVTYAAKLSTTTTDSSIQGLLGGLYYGVGKGSGSLIGGYLMKAFGTRPTYQIFSGMSLVTGIVYFLFNALYLRKRPQVEGNDIVKKKPKKVENAEGASQTGAETEPKEKSGVIFAKDKTSYGSENKAFSVADDVDVEERTAEKTKQDVYEAKEIEAIKNARNLDRIEKIDEAERNGGNEIKDSKDESVTDDVESGDGSALKVAGALNGSTNLAYDKEDEDVDAGKCNVTIEKQPDDRK